MAVKTVGAVSAFALAAVLSTAAFAQGPGGGQGQERMETPGRSMQQTAPGQQQTTPGQQMAPGQQKTAPGQQRRGEQAQQPDGKQQRQAEQPDRKDKQRAEQPERRGKQRAEQPDRKEKQRAEQPERREKQRAEQPDRKEKQRAEQPERKEKQAERQGRTRLSEQQRTSVRERLRQGGALERARVSSVNFDISVGTRVPRDRIELVALPAVIAEEVPAYRGHLYFVVRDEIVIVQPSTYVIVDVIRLDGAPARAARAEGRLTLTREQRRVVLSNIDLQPGVRLGIGGISVGTTLPGTVELRSFPQAVTAEVPELREYRYIVFERDIAIVDPEQRQVVLTIGQ